MGEAITISAKREFIRWFLNNYQFKKNEGSWLFNYFLTDDRLLEKVHFTDDLYNREKTMIISTVCSHATPFLYQKKSRLNYDVEEAFNDIKENPNEDVYINIFFKDRMSCPQYLIVLEGRGKTERQGQTQPRVTQDNMAASLMTELVIDQLMRSNRLKELTEQIDAALVKRDKPLFMKLTEEWNELRRWAGDLHENNR
ncbi:hypothetical protein BEP19_01960 [Ammoniphilus oxalaticus]|uniref:IDEAL domain-containing protein n=1 Tax=Ammoniphilus oxalaticus TaxID=66863 RepID=A0A419SND4_9BACL|nr:YpiB family protein [Ammoniphilus oxalaticus]RKD25731.1 hypothetical protein BEP19_01960 [Ammoniphilus oxalaticus]